MTHGPALSSQVCSIYTVSANSTGQNVVVYIINAPTVEETELFLIFAIGKENLNVIVVYMINVPTKVEIDQVIEMCGPRTERMLYNICCFHD